LFAHCVALTLNATHDAYARRHRALVHAGRLAETLSLDMVAAGWVPTAENYLGRVTKARILEAVREVKGEQAADRLTALKKGEMVSAAEGLLVGTGWLPEPLRTKGVTTMPAVAGADGVAISLEVGEEQVATDLSDEGNEVPADGTGSAHGNYSHDIAAE
jgi:ParB family chromosome partitioning protein